MDSTEKINLLHPSTFPETRPPQIEDEHCHQKIVPPIVKKLENCVRTYLMPVSEKSVQFDCQSCEKNIEIKSDVIAQNVGIMGHNQKIIHIDMGNMYAIIIHNQKKIDSINDLIN